LWPGAGTGVPRSPICSSARWSAPEVTCPAITVGKKKREERREKRGGPIILAWPASAVTDHVNCGHIIIRVFWLIEI